MTKNNKIKKYFNREMSLIDFNRRVLRTARDEKLPLMERLRYILISASNLDEFFNVRAAKLIDKANKCQTVPSIDGLMPMQALHECYLSTEALVAEQTQAFSNIMGLLAKEGYKVVSGADRNKKDRKFLADYFNTKVRPLLTPVALDQSHPFPSMVNGSLHFLIELKGSDGLDRDTRLVSMHMPNNLPSLIKLDGAGTTYVTLSSLIKENAESLFPSLKVKGCHQFRITRSSNMKVNARSMSLLEQELRGELKKRPFGAPVRLEVSESMPKKMVEMLMDSFGMSSVECVSRQKVIDFSRFKPLLDDAKPHMLFQPYERRQLEIPRSSTIFESIDEQDILLHHPYDDFAPVVEFLNTAAIDPDVMSIKQTVYRVGENSEIADAIINAAKNGKQVTAVIEIQARFDESTNLELAARLRKAGALVVFGVIGKKTHAKMSLVSRMTRDGVRHYTHLGTGNYHSLTTKIYDDYGVLTANQDLANEVAEVFNTITGLGVPKLKMLMTSPNNIADSFSAKLKEYSKLAKEGKEVSATIKMNSLCDKHMIDELYKASRAGVKIRLIVRGICSLVPGVKGQSENIEVYSVIGRFLEHARVYTFTVDGQSEVWCSSADWMERNLYNRVEVCFPIVNDGHKQTIIEDLEAQLVPAKGLWKLNSDGAYLEVDGKEDRYHNRKLKG
ncbi:polyphosphate kinase [Vibrio phage vB_VcorM_GR11A]|nr:polyphosphate kinase [Vibrio phage vB_VcorM_GR11A]